MKNINLKKVSEEITYYVHYITMNRLNCIGTFFRFICYFEFMFSIYKHQGRKPTTLEWWDECRLID